MTGRKRDASEAEGAGEVLGETGNGVGRRRDAIGSWSRWSRCFGLASVVPLTAYTSIFTVAQCASQRKRERLWTPKVSAIEAGHGIWPVTLQTPSYFIALYILY